VNPKVWIHGQRVELNGLSILNIGCTTRPKGGEADIWVAHAPPTKTLVATRPNGGDGGNPHPVVPVRRYAPRLVLAGHVHNPIHWLDYAEPTLFLNPGRRRKRRTDRARGHPRPRARHPRTEFVFVVEDHFPSEEEQYQTYRKSAECIGIAIWSSASWMSAVTSCCPILNAHQLRATAA
jgi:hypothetical protein